MSRLTPRRTVVGYLAIAGAILVVWGAAEVAVREKETGSSEPSVSVVESPEAASPSTDLIEKLIQLPIGPSPYLREAFGQRWADVDRTGCDQRNESLAAAMTEISYRAGTNDCVVETGTFHDVYDGSSWPFSKTQDGGGIEIDHIVPLEHAWDMGASTWTEGEREQFANELGNLQATAGTYNSAKGSKSPHEWMPPDVAYHCTYLQRWSEIKVTWGLALEAAERDYLLNELTRCSAS